MQQAKEDVKNDLALIYILDIISVVYGYAYLSVNDFSCWKSVLVRSTTHLPHPLLHMLMHKGAAHILKPLL